MKMWKKLLIAVLPMTLMLAFPSLAGQWRQDATGWWYENDDGSYYNDGWHWIDGNGDGVAECYFFGFDGYMMKGPGKVDGCWVDENGAWVSEDGLQTKEVGTDASAPKESGSAGNGMSQDAYALYQAAQAKNNSLDSMDTRCAYDMTMGVDGSSISLTMNLDMKMKGVRDNSPQFIMNGNINMLGSEIPVSMFYTDGYFYMDLMGEKIRQSMPMDEALREASKSTQFVDANLSGLKDLQMRAEGSSTVLSYTMDAQALTGMMQTIMESGMAGMSDIKADYKIHSASGEIYVNQDGYYTRQTVNLDMDMTMTDASGSSETMNCKMKMEMDINNPGQPVDFAIPSTEGYRTADQV